MSSVCRECPQLFRSRTRGAGAMREARIRRRKWKRRLGKKRWVGIVVGGYFLDVRRVWGGVGRMLSEELRHVGGKVEDVLLFAKVFRVD